MSEHALRVAVVGCGNISGAYGETMSAYRSVRIAGATDVDGSLSAAFVDRFGGVVYPSLGDVLGDPDVDAIVNLTFPAVHADVTTAALNAGKHVHSEKPLAGNYATARSLVDLATERGLRLSCSPITFLGEAQQTMWRLAETGAIGNVRVAYAEVNWNRIESWHPRPEPFYGIGPFADVGVYPLTILTAMFGPARRVTAFGTVVYPERTTLTGEPFTPGAPDFGVAVLELESGTVVRLTANFYVSHVTKQRGIELHGDTGSIYLSDWQEFDATVELAPFGEPYRPVAVENAFRGTDWGRALDDLSGAIVSGRPHRATGAQAAHIVEVLDAIATSVAERRAVEITSSFAPPGLGSNGSRPA
jgi:predicted dehydrogenase